MIDLSLAQLHSMVVHHVGNPKMGEPLTLSESTLDLPPGEYQELLNKYFLAGFETPEHFTFSAPEEEEEVPHPVIQSVVEIFQDPGALHRESVRIAEHLYAASQHANIKPGDLSIVYFDQLNFEDELTDAIGIFKSETKHPYIKFIEEGQQIGVSFDAGFPLEKLDKGCVIFNTEQGDGYRAFILDRTSRGSEAIFWREDFLSMVACSDAYTFTSNLLTMTKSFVSKQLGREEQMEKPDQIDILNKTMAYFNENESYDESGFTNSVFGDENVAEKFKAYQQECARDLKMDVADTFDISYPAVKKQSRGFRSVIKLDKNFHIYVHGNRERIERGEDPDGRKYYKLYFDLES